MHPDYPIEAKALAVEPKFIEEDPSQILKLLGEQRTSLELLDMSLADLARKVRPVTVDLPTKDDDSTKPEPVLSAVNMQIVRNIEFTHRLRELIKSLTNSLQV